ncbi:MAG: secondary thiamine-phosphate synthase enzyme YjbQ [Candidatus Omnitrophica bacterium]|nr:secondary thiamine-phosphate synthase enzyme YjbQ [Candidatus Omnitrophota bacterium]
MPVEIKVPTQNRCQMVEITREVARAIRELKIEDGGVVVLVPHTTAGITIQENADPDVVRDMLMEIEKIVPFEDGYHHMEGNSAAHIKTTLFGNSVHLLVENGEPLFGTWQGVYLCEFDGPRTRKVWVKEV